MCYNDLLDTDPAALAALFLFLLEYLENLGIFYYVSIMWIPQCKCGQNWYHDVLIFYMGGNINFSK